jgi:hypothetical protein
MQHTMSRTLLVAVSSAGLVLGGAVSAGAADKDKDKDKGKGWVEVCQEITHKKKDDKGKDKDRNSYHGLYKVVDSKDKVYWVKLKGKDDCDSVKVNKGWAKVSVKGQPEDTKLKSKKNQWTHVKKGKTSTVTFEYEAKKDKKDDKD